MRELVFDTNGKPLLVIGRDEDTRVRLLGPCDSIVLQLPCTTTAGRTIFIESADYYKPAIKVRTADYGADNLRVVRLFEAGGIRSRESFVFDNGYWQWQHRPVHAG